MFQLANIKYKDVINITELNIEANKITTIVGKSGSGKTTLLKLLNNIITVDEGSLKYKGKEITDYNPLKLRREILMLPQNPVMFPTSIKDNFSKTIEFSECKNINTKYRKLLKKVYLEHDLQTNTENLSGGEKQRLALARVLLLQPKILLLDEPSASLDDDTEEFIIQMVVNYIKEKNGTLIMVTHSRTIANKYSDKIITLKRGQIKNIETGVK